MCGKDYIWNPRTCTCENGKYLVNIIGDSVITCDKIIEVKKSIPTKNVAAKTFPTKTDPTKTIPTSLSK